MNKNIFKNVFVLFSAGFIALASVFLVSNAVSLTADENGKPKHQAQEQAPEQDNRTNPLEILREGTMTLGEMRSIITRLDENAQEPRPGAFQFLISDFEVMVITAEPVNRMRVMVRIRSSEGLTREDLLRIAQANLDSALDARYAIGRGVLWSTYIHPLSSLHPRQFIEAIGSTVNLAANYGTTYSSGQLFFGGGDSRGILGRKLIDELIKKGQPI